MKAHNQKTEWGAMFVPKVGTFMGRGPSCSLLRFNRKVGFVLAGRRGKYAKVTVINIPEHWLLTENSIESWTLN